MNFSGRAGGGAAVAAVTILAALAGCTPQPSQPPGARASSASSAPQASTAPPTTAPATPAEGVLSARVTYPWRWPNGAGQPPVVQHSYRVPPVPELVAIAVGDHPRTAVERAYNRMSFTFTTAFPSYQFQFVDGITADGSGKPIPLAGNSGALKIIFRQAQAHTGTGASAIVSQPPAHLGLTRMASWARAGDFEGVLTVGIGIDRPVLHSNPQFPVRVTEVEKVTAQGRHLYVVAFDVDATQPGG